MEIQAGWYQDPWFPANLRWWQDGQWTGYGAVRRPTQAEVDESNAFILGALGLVGLYFPFGGFVLGIWGTILAIRGVRMSRDSGTSVFALGVATTDVALSVSAFIWSVMTGLAGIVTSPAPP